jgi:hypothetical protein
VLREIQHSIQQHILVFKKMELLTTVMDLVLLVMVDLQLLPVWVEAPNIGAAAAAD